MAGLDESDPSNSFLVCDFCRKDVSNELRMVCAECETGITMCISCVSQGHEAPPHSRSHRFRLIKKVAEPVVSRDWQADEEVKLLDAIAKFGMGNWDGVAKSIGSKTPKECEDHYFKAYLESPEAPLPVLLRPDDDGSGGSPEHKERSYELSEPPPNISGLWDLTYVDPSAAKEGPLQGIHPTLLQHASSLGFLPLRRDFDVEYENGFETVLADMEFRDEDPQDLRDLKLSVLHEYNTVLDQRLQRKRFVFERGVQFARQLALKRTLQKDEREIWNNLRPFARFHSADDHERLVTGLINELKLRKRIQQLQFHRLNGLQTLQEGKMFENHKRQREEDRTKSDASYVAPFPPVEAFKLQPVERPTKRLKPNEPLNLASHSGFEQLNSAEKKFCAQMHFTPEQYQLIKDSICREAYRAGLVDKSKKNNLLTVEINNSGKVLDAFVCPGWRTPSAAAASGEATAAAAAAPGATIDAAARLDPELRAIADPLAP